MVAEVINDLIDDFTVLNLLPRTFKGLKKTSNQNDMELIHNHHKFVAIKSSENCMGLARSILERNSEDVNNGLPCPVQSDNKEEDIVVEREKVRGKESRRGLLGHHERPKFSLKPKAMSQTNLNLKDMEKEIEKISDPNEFFKAYERLENAKKEIQRQTGGIPANPIKDNTSRTTRVRQPDLGIVRHKHRYSLVGAGSNEVFSSQFETDFSSQSRNEPNTVTMDQHDPTTVTMDQHDPTVENILMNVGLEKDLVAAAQNNVNRILDELLSTSCTDLDGDGAVVPFMQERLQIKPINVEKLSLPDLDSFRSISVMATAKSAGKSRESLSEMESLIRQSRNKTSTETSPESPLASVSLLRKRLSQMGQTASPFSFCGIDYSPVRSTSLIKGKDIRDHSPDVGCAQNNEANDTTAEAPDKKASSASCEFQSAMLVNDDTAGTNTVSEKLAMDTAVCSAGGPGGVLQDKVEDVCQETATSQQKETDLEGLWNTDCSGGLLDGVNSIVGERRPGDGDSLAANIHLMQNNEVEDMRPKGVASEQKEPELEDLSLGDIDCSGSQLGNITKQTLEHQTGDAVPQNSVVFTEQNKETYPEPSLNENSKRKPPLENRIERQKSHRKSLAGAGTEGESEVRRSTRPRTRPLKYWKREQFLDGRAQNESVSSMGNHQTGDLVSENPDILAEQHNETYPEPSLNENRKKKAPAQNRKERQSTHRKSLADESESSTGKHQTGDVVSENPDILTEQQDERTYPKPSLNKNRKKKAPVQNRMERRSTRQKSLADESVSPGKHQIGDAVSENPNILVEQHDETYPEPSLNENRKKKAPAQNRKERRITRRKSLAGAGSKWESGVRRSTRHRIRPLEYWKGERMLYARIHESLITVIGVKYESPPKSKKEKPTFRVKSYVSDEYKELVVYAALH